MVYFTHESGQIGHLLVVLSFAACLLSALAYFFATQQRDKPESEGWRNIGRFSFLVHGFATLGIIASLFFILVNKYYEYQYAWSNISDDLPFKYTFSAFWKEQQGSFLLWSFWHIILGVLLILRSGKWEGPVMTIIALAEGFIGSMLLGLYIGSKRLGASPFDLLRDTMDAPIFQQADYLSKISGNGLNPLLQNYWMTIHPPTLFLGFASTIVPFAFAFAGLWLRDHKDWLRPALQWSLFSGAILGTGILMGGAWAYEALSFGGYWAWDPVENTSLVPWIIMVAGIHANLIARNTGYSIKSTYAYYLLSFILILYSTYLTRSGILGDTSAHAFTEMGLGLQLILFIGIFSLMSLVMFFSRIKGIPEIKREESVKSREFWMFIGALVLFFSAVLITGSTSLPVWNKIVKSFSPDYIGAALKDPIAHHNRYQLWIAVFMGLLSGIAQFMRYNERNWQGWFRKFGVQMGIATAGAVLLTMLNAMWLEAHAWQYFALLFAAMFTLVANASYLFTVLKGNLKLGASAVSHFGFGVLVLGIMGTGLNKQWLSTNPFAMDGLIEGADAKTMNQNIILMKEAPMPMKNGLEATYLQDTVERQTRTFKVQFRQLDANGNLLGDPFVLEPNVMYDRQFSKVVAANPSTQHYWNRDIFTHVTSLPRGELDRDFAKSQEDSLQFQSYDATVGDTIFTKKHYIIVEGITKQPQHHDYQPQKGDLAFGLQLRVYSLDNPKSYPAQPVMYIRPGQGGFTLPADIGQMQMRIRLTEATMEKIFKTEGELKSEQFPLHEGESFQYKGYDVRFTKVERNVEHQNYSAEPGDIAVAAMLDIKTPNGKQYAATPVYMIRNNQPFSLKDEVPAEGLHFQFSDIDPKTGVLTVSIAQADAIQRSLPVDIAENAPRSDYIVLEAILFPGINLVWLGSIMMLIGLSIGLFNRLKPD
ncbi:MAG: cytochrome c biogenesis protein CcsA [Lewinellaceae bacterium]|nr:cytochrome c biogenesis protein CcsA [Lewinellaceae bacterium]